MQGSASSSVQFVSCSLKAKMKTARLSGPRRLSLTETPRQNSAAADLSVIHTPQASGIMYGYGSVLRTPRGRSRIFFKNNPMHRRPISALSGPVEFAAAVADDRVHDLCYKTPEVIRRASPWRSGGSWGVASPLYVVRRFRRISGEPPCIHYGTSGRSTLWLLINGHASLYPVVRPAASNKKIGNSHVWKST
jgi:hypothetical protein